MSTGRAGSFAHRLMQMALISFCALALTTSCGGGKSDDGTLGSFAPGLARYVLPFIGTAGSGESATLVLANTSSDPAPVTVQAFAPNAGALPGGAPYAAPEVIVVPAAGQVRRALTTLTGGGPLLGGWLAVDSRSATVFDAVSGEPVGLATTGHVFPSIERVRSGVTPRHDVSTGIGTRAGGVAVTLLEDTTGIQILNDTHDPVPGGPVDPMPLDVIATFYDVDGDVVTTTPLTIPPQGSVSLAPAVTTGHVRIEPDLTGVPAARVIAYAAGAREDSFHVHTERRFQEASDTDLPGQYDAGFEVDFGTDVYGNVSDFGVVMSNPTTTDQAVVLAAVFTSGGVPVVADNRAVLLPAGRTVYMSTTDIESRGLVVGESSIFADIFGDPTASPARTRVSLFFQVPRSVDISARAFDSSFDTYHRRVGAQLRTKAGFVVDLPIQTTTTIGTRTWLQLTNTTGSDIDVPMRLFTPGGTEYVLDTIVVPAFTRVDWSPDGTIYREDPTDTVGPPVTRVGILVTPLGGLFVRGMTRDTNALNLTVLESSRAMWPGD